MRKLRNVLAGLLLSTGLAQAQTLPALPFNQVRSFMYLLQNVNVPRQVTMLGNSKFDMVILEPTRTCTGNNAFNIKAAVSQIKAMPASDKVHRKLVLAYVDIGQAEDYRWYWNWSTTLTAGSVGLPSDWPSYIVSADPAWAGDYPVAYWDPRWKNIMINGVSSNTGYNSAMQEVVQDGFDGIVMDCVDSYSLPEVQARAAAQGVDPAAEMVKFIGELRAYGKAANPNFIIVQHNAGSLMEDTTGDANVVDGMAQESTWYGGQGGAGWYNATGYDQRTDPATTTEAIRLLNLFKAKGKMAFTIDYAVNNAAWVYHQSTMLGFVPLCTRVSLSSMTGTFPLYFRTL